MIQTDRQLNITKNKIKEFESALQELDLQKGNIDANLYILQQAPLSEMLNRLKLEVEEYTALKNEDCKGSVYNRFDLADLPRMLVKCRLVNKWSQSDLGRKVGVAPQQIQRYEANNYSGVKFDTIVELAEAVGLGIRCDGFHLSNENFDIGDENPEDQVVLMEKLLIKDNNIFDL